MESTIRQPNAIVDYWKVEEEKNLENQGNDTAHNNLPMMANETAAFGEALAQSGKRRKTNSVFGYDILSKYGAKE